MATSESRGGDVPNLYDGLAGIIVLSILARAFLHALQLIFDILLTVAFGSAYAAGRVDDLEHAVVVAKIDRYSPTLHRELSFGLKQGDQDYRQGIREAFPTKQGGCNEF